jgi:A/G-specific adenine glycosylase
MNALPLSPMTDDSAFQRQVHAYYRLHGRHDLPWRQAEADGRFDPYKILVSEAMLQQTQVGRVIPKFTAFVEQFPDTRALAQAPLGDVLRAWNGLGYNRRAKFLREAARHIIDHFGNIIPDEQTELARLPGVGLNTAGAIRAYAFNRPVVFVETNIRTVFIHHYFADQTAVHDRAVLEIVARTLPEADVRGWYWALMDYGSYLKRSVGNLNQASRNYTKQSRFTGSRRQIRGQVIRLLGDQPRTALELEDIIKDERLVSVLVELEREQLIHRAGQSFSL